MKSAPSRLGLLSVVLVLFLGGSVLFVRTSGRDTPWLGGPGPASWIVYPSPGSPGPRPVVELESVFLRAFDLDTAPEHAELGVRGFRKGVVWVNGQPVANLSGGDWKTIQRVDVSRFLRPGVNQLVARVVNDRGPPSLWLSLTVPGGQVVSDEQWEVSWAGATPRRAGLASEPVRGRRHDVHRRLPSPWEGLWMHWGMIGVLAALGGASAHVISRLGKPSVSSTPRSSQSRWPLPLTLVGCGILWITLLLHNNPLLPVSTGFDAVHHLDYVQWILDKGTIPLATDGWQMFQPPLYYLALALPFAASGASTGAAHASTIVRMTGLATGLAHLLLVAACMRLIFPGRVRAQVLGVFVGAFLPCMLYMHHFPANELLAAALSTGALLVGLTISRGSEGRPSWALLGFLLGLALLTKVSTIIMLVAILGVLSLQAVFGDRAILRRRLLGLTIAATAFFVTCGWNYFRVWLRLGRPFVGGWEAERGMGWWQDPGFRTLADFLRFGRALTEPAFAGNNGFWDGWYVTLWGDGLLSGLGFVDLTLPWASPSLMAAACLLALVPSTALLVGACTELLDWVRRPSAVSGMLLLLAFLTLLAIGLMCIEVPSVVADKATYGLMALVPLAAFCATALDNVMSRGPLLRTIATALLVSWAGTSYATYWIVGGSPDGRMQAVPPIVRSGEWLKAMRMLHDIASGSPDHWPSHIMLADLMLDLEAPEKEVERMLDARPSWPDVAGHHLVLSRLADREGALDRALVEARLAVRLAPEDPGSLRQLALLLAKAGEAGESIRVWRDVLALDAHDVVAHRQLALLLAQTGDVAGSDVHRSHSARLGRAISVLPDR